MAVNNKFIVNFKTTGAVDSTSITGSLRQGDVGTQLEIYAPGINDNTNYVAIFNFTRHDGAKITNVSMIANGYDQSDVNWNKKYHYTFADEWFFAKAGSTTLTIYVKNGSGTTVAFGQVQFTIEETDYDDDPDTITTEQYDSLVATIAGLGNTYVTLATEQSITGFKKFIGGLIEHAREINGSTTFDEFIESYGDDEYKMFVKVTGTPAVVGILKYSNSEFTFTDFVNVYQTPANEITGSTTIRDFVTGNADVYTFNGSYLTKEGNAVITGTFTFSSKPVFNNGITYNNNVAIDVEENGVHKAVSFQSGKAGYIALTSDLTPKEDKSNKVTSINGSSTNNQYPSAKAVWDIIKNKLGVVIFEISDSVVDSLTNENVIFTFDGDTNLYIGHYSEDEVVVEIESLNSETRFVCTLEPDSTATFADVMIPANLDNYALSSDLNGKENTSNKVTSMTASSTDTQYPSAKAVYDAIQLIVSIATGATSSFSVNPETTGNSAFQSDNATITCTSFTDVDGNTIIVSNLKKGDLVFTLNSQSNKYKDRWLVNPSTGEWGMIDADTPNLSNYYNKSQVDALFALAYDNTATYSVGAKCINNGKLWTANTNISTPEDFDSSHWDEISVSSGFVDKDSAQTITGVKKFSNGINIGNGSQLTQTGDGSLQVTLSGDGKAFKPSWSEHYNIGAVGHKWKDGHFSGQVYAENTLNIINANDIVNNTLTSEQLAIVLNGKPTLFKGTVNGLTDVILLSYHNYTSYYHFVSICGNTISNVEILPSGDLHFANYGSESNGIGFNDGKTIIRKLANINGKTFPDYPTSPANPKVLIYDTDNTLKYTDLPSGGSSIPTITVAFSDAISQNPLVIQLDQPRYNVFASNKQVIVDVSALGQNTVIWNYQGEGSDYLYFSFTSNDGDKVRGYLIKIDKVSYEATYTDEAAAEWGYINGSISDQSDLANALNAKQNVLDDQNMNAGTPLHVVGFDASHNLVEGLAGGVGYTAYVSGTPTAQTNALKFVKLSQTEYNNLQNVDANTFYIITSNSANVQVEPVVPISNGGGD